MVQGAIIRADVGILGRDTCSPPLPTQDLCSPVGGVQPVDTVPATSRARAAHPAVTSRGRSRAAGGAQGALGSALAGMQQSGSAAGSCAAKNRSGTARLMARQSIGAEPAAAAPGLADGESAELRAALPQPLSCQLPLRHHCYGAAMEAAGDPAVRSAHGSVGVMGMGTGRGEGMCWNRSGAAGRVVGKGLLSPCTITLAGAGRDARGAAGQRGRGGSCRLLG